jgi:hypothetical protein
MTVTGRPSRGEARTFVEDSRLFDTHDIATALTLNTGDAAVVTFDMHWLGGGELVRVHDAS